MDPDVLRVVMEIAAFFAIAAAARTRRIARRAHLVAAVPMAIAVASFNVFTIIVAPFGDRYGI